jgi:hypothetical protein
MPLSTFKEVLHVIRGVLAWKIRPMPIKTYLLVLRAYPVNPLAERKLLYLGLDKD